jgi:hypothetical protein
VSLHLGTEEDFHPAKRAHPAFVVDALDEIVAACERAGLPTRPDTSFNDFRRVHVFDPFGNRLELMESTIPSARSQTLRNLPVLPVPHLADRRM